MKTSIRTQRLVAASLSVLLLLSPALWNGFPLLEYDTGGYFARWYEGTLEVSRSTVYGLFLVALARPDFWPVVIAQSVGTVWVVALVLRAQGLGHRPLALLVTVGVLALTTTLPWIASVLLTDVFAGLAVLAMYLVVVRGDSLGRWERLGLIALTAFAAASHSATLVLLLGLLVVAVAVRFAWRRFIPISGLQRGAAALVLGAAMLVAANYAVAGRLSWTPGGIALSFGRMLQDGIVARYLAEHCPDPRFRLCEHQAELPPDADTFFWGKSIFDRLGRFDGLGEEMRTVVIESIKAYPLWQIEAALTASGRQLLMVASGEGVNNSIWHTHGMIENLMPSALPAMRAARQQKDEIDFTPINRLHVPVAYGSMALLALLLIAGAVESVRTRGRDPNLAAVLRGDDGDRIEARIPAGLLPLACTVAVAILGNAAVCGVFANPHDRYGARVVWLATLVVAFVPWLVRTRRDRPSNDATAG
jgi:hypothetical protein